MNAENLFARALGINSPWKIESLSFDSQKKSLDIHVDFAKGSKFPYEDPETGEITYYTAYDTVEKTWRHLNFFEHVCYLHARVPRIQPKDGGTKMVFPPWSGKVYGFTLLFEALILQMCTHMPVHQAGKILKASDHKLWKVLEGYTAQGLFQADCTNVHTVGIDETSLKKNHNYITLFVDLASKRTLFITQGKNHKTVAEFAEVLESGNGHPHNITDVSCDMSPAFIKGVTKSLPKARITFDRFHIMKIINTAVDAVRRDESRENPILKGSRYVFLKNKDNLNGKQKKVLESLSQINLKSFRALHMREAFQALYHSETVEEFKLKIKKWYFWATHSKLPPMIKAAKTIKNHLQGIIAWKESHINNGILEGLNSVIQAAKRKARGYKIDHFKVMAYLLTGKLNLSKINPYLPTHF